jgi:hypothetical protein
VRLALLLLVAVTAVPPDPPAAIRLEAPFDELFSTSQTKADYSVDGTLTEAGKPATPVKVSVRGHTSRRESECAFPKLKIQRADGSTLKLGTHCGESAGDTLSTKYGRLPNERSPWREAAVYHVLQALAVPTLQAQAVRVTYVYPDARTLERNAMIIEDDDDAARRIGGAKPLEADAFTSADQVFAASDAATLAFAEALVGNFDWCVKFTPSDTYRCDAKNKLWNVIAVPMPGGKARPVVHDLDISGMVTGSHAWFKSAFNADFIPSASPREIEVVSQVQRTRTLFPRAELDAARQRFLSRKDAAYRALADVPVDQDGRAIITEYLDAFFRAIDTDEHFYRPVVVVKGTLARAGPGATAAALCAERGPIPVGTPVSDVRETRGSFIKVVLLDSLWHWATPNHCAPIKTGAVWIPASAISRDFPNP